MSTSKIKYRIERLETVEIDRQSHWLSASITASILVISFTFKLLAFEGGSDTLGQVLRGEDEAKLAIVRKHIPIDSHFEKIRIVVKPNPTLDKDQSAPPYSKYLGILEACHRWEQGNRDKLDRFEGLYIAYEKTGNEGSFLSGLHDGLFVPLEAYIVLRKEDKK